MRQTFIQPQARVDLLDIWHHIAHTSTEAANKVTLRLESEIEALAEFPGKGHRRADVADARYLFWSVYSYMIAYRFDETSLRVIRVIHGARNFRNLFPDT